MLEDLVKLHRAGHLDEAEEGYRRLLADAPDNAEVLLLLGILRGQRGGLPEATDLVRRACEIAPGNAACQLTLGEMYLAGGKLDEAARAYAESNRLSPDLAAAQGGLGQVALQRGDVRTAEHHFRIALHADENDVLALTGLAKVARIRGDAQRALQLLTQAAQLAPDDPLIQTSFAQAMLDQGMLDFAVRAADNALAAKPDYPLAQVLRAELHVRKGELGPAAAIYHALLARGEQVGLAHTGLGDIARAGGRHAAAIAEYDEALRAEPGLHLAAIRRADTLAFDGRLAQAIEDLRAHVAGHPENPQTHAQLARLLTQAARYDEALAEWEGAEARWPKEMDLKAQHALTLDRAGRSDEALALAEVAADSTRPALAMLRARGALLAGDPAAAVQRLQRVDRRQLEGKPSRLARRHQRLLGLAYDALEQWQAAADAFMQSQRLGGGSLPELPALDEAVGEVLHALANEPALDHADGVAPILLCGLPGSGVGQVAALLADQPGWFVRSERFEAIPDFVNAPFDPRLLKPLDQAALEALARRYRRPLQRAGVADTARVVDWIPVLDARVVPAIKRALPGARLVIVQREAHDMLLDWLAFGWSETLAMPDPLAGARWLRLAATHLAAAADLLPTFHVDHPDALLAEAGSDLRKRLGVFLEVVAMEPGALTRGARKGRGGMPVSFAPGHSSHYREVLSEAFATLDNQEVFAMV